MSFHFVNATGKPYPDDLVNSVTFGPNSGLCNFTFVTKLTNQGEIFVTFDKPDISLSVDLLILSLEKALEKPYRKEDITNFYSNKNKVHSELIHLFTSVKDGDEGRPYYTLFKSTTIHAVHVRERTLYIDLYDYNFSMNAPTTITLQKGEELRRFISEVETNDKYRFDKVRFGVLKCEDEYTHFFDTPKSLGEIFAYVEKFYSQPIDKVYLDYLKIRDDFNELSFDDINSKIRYDVIDAIDSCYKTKIIGLSFEYNTLGFRYEIDYGDYDFSFEKLMAPFFEDLDKRPIKIQKEEEDYIDDRPYVSGKFFYKNSTGVKEYPNVEKNISSVVFDISRYGEHRETIKFKENVTIKYAVEEVEKYLSEPVTEEYFERVEDDLFDSDMDWEGLTRGDLLTDARYLEEFYINNNVLEFGIGS